jgi:hypothetical protein
LLPERRLRIWSDRGFVPPGIPHTPILWPFWGPAVEPEEWQNAGRFDRWAEIGAAWFELAGSPSDAAHTANRAYSVHADVCKMTARQGQGAIAFGYVSKSPATLRTCSKKSKILVIAGTLKASASLNIA